MAKQKAAKKTKTVKATPKRAAKPVAKGASKPAGRTKPVVKAVAKATVAAKPARATATSAKKTSQPALKVAPAPAKLAKPVVKERVKTPVPVAAPAPSNRTSVQWGSQRLDIIDQDAPLPKTHLNKRELRRFSQLLLDKRRELVGDMEKLTNEALKGNQASDGPSHMPLHMADVGSDNWEQEFSLGLIENERGLVREIDEALQRIEDRTYGVCVATHRPIDNARLLAKPWAKYCIEYARLRELGRVP